MRLPTVSLSGNKSSFLSNLIRAMAFLKHFGLFIVWLLIIFYLSFTPLTDWPQPSLFQKLYIDKVVHVFMYCLLSFFLLRGLFRQQKNDLLRYPTLAAAVAFCAMIGIAIEFLQPVLTMYRRFEWLDMVANAAGAVTGWLLCEGFKSLGWLGLKKYSRELS